MVRVGDSLGRPIVRALDDAPANLRPLRGVLDGMSTKKRGDRDGVNDVDRFDGSKRDPSREPNPNHGGRDRRGRYNGDGSRPWVDKEKLGLDKVAKDEGVYVHRDQVRATIDGLRKKGASADQPRYYDGLYRNPDGTYTGVEVKSGDGDRNADQKRFDGSVSRENPATAVLNGNPIQIVNVHLEKVK